MNYFIYIFWAIVSFTSQGQSVISDNEKEMFLAIRTNDVDKIDSLMKIYPRSIFSIYAATQKKYLESATIDNIILDDSELKKSIKNEREKLLYQLLQGDFYLENVKNDSLAFSIYQKTLRKAKKQKDTLLICESYKKLISVLFKNGEQRKVFKEYLKDYTKHAYDLNEIAYAEYFLLGYKMLTVERDSAIIDFTDKDFMNLISKADKSKNKLLLAYSQQLYGVKLWAYDKDYSKALNYYNKAKETYQSIDTKVTSIKLFGILVNIAAIYIEWEKSEIALQFLHQAKNIKLPDKNKKDYILYYDKLIKSHVLRGNKDSIFYYLQLKDKAEKYANTQDQAKTVSELETKYQTAEKEKQILEEQQKVRTNRNWLIAACLALFLGAGIAVLFQKNTTKKRQLAEQEALLKQERVDNLLKEQELVSIDAMIAGQEKERQRVANELHDDLGSLMATIKLHFDNSTVSKKDPALKNAQKLLEEAYQKVRSMAHSKNSGVMSDQGLLPAIKKMAQVITETNALKVAVEDFGMGDRLENSLELNLFRMVQELVANAIKHAEATKVTIQLTQHEDNLNIIIEDNGKGFDRSKIETDKTGMGLTTIEKRVEHLEGNFTIDSILGKGTSILIDIPV
ncbi:sensor histidine kinase [uncultured Croceitalea sp.]|uniref:sensor histidine kinase n=1 Tax=uncultured Croceitalea sp. TaxID=1798908 RepID=UPI0033061FC8